jgi:hypothetical protein
MAEVETPATRHPSRYTLLVAASAALSILAILVVAVGAAAVFFAPPPEVFVEHPVHLASNPGDPPANWDFSSQHPTLHPGDQLIGDFHVCYRDVFGGQTVDVQGRRSIVSLDGTTRAALNPIALTFSVGCHDTRTVIDVIPNPFPAGVYRVSGMTAAIATYYSRRVDWVSVPFDVVEN